MNSPPNNLFFCPEPQHHQLAQIAGGDRFVRLQRHFFHASLLALLGGFGVATSRLPAATDAVHIEPSTIFSAKDIPGGGALHLPSLLVTRRGTVLAVCQMRKSSPGDWGHDTDVILRRSQDGGITWGPTQVIFSEAGVNAVNGPLVEVQENGTIILPFTKVPAGGGSMSDWVQSQISIGGGIWIQSSQDEGKTWSRPVETKPSGPTGWVAWANNSSHGVEFPDGRLVIPGMAQRLEPEFGPSHAMQYSACLLLSDDHGRTWHIGAITPYYGTDEVAVTICGDGSLLASIRINNRQPNDLVRLLARSRDRGESFTESSLVDHLSLNDCHAGLTSAREKSWRGERSVIVHSGPQGGNVQQPLDRSHLSLRLSFDDGQSWPVSKLIATPRKDTEYSDVGVAADGTIMCLYGVDTFSKTESRMELVRFNLRSFEIDRSSFN